MSPESPSAPEVGDRRTESVGSGSSSSMVTWATLGVPALTPAGNWPLQICMLKVSSSSAKLSSVVRTVPVAVVLPAGTVRVMGLESKSTPWPVAQMAAMPTLTAVAVWRVPDRVTPTVTASPSSTL